MVAISVLGMMVLVPGTSEAAPEGSYVIVDRGEDSCGMATVMRRGYFIETEPEGSGFGRDKIEYKHFITNRQMWKWLLRAPGCGQPMAGAGTKYRYDGYVDNFSCDRVSATCRTIDSMPIRLELDQRQLDLPPNTPSTDLVFGVITMYCNKSDTSGTPLVQCPPWVSRAIPAA